MSTLQENVDIIKAQVARMKTALGVDPATPLEEVTTTIEQGGGGSSAKSNIYKVATIEERDAITDMVEGDTCLVYFFQESNIDQTVNSKEFTLPDVVVLPEAIIVEGFSYLRDSDYMEMMDFYITPTICSIRFQLMTDYIMIEYASEDGITYTKTSGPTNVIASNNLSFPSDEQEWLSCMSYFLLSQQLNFEGMFNYHDNVWKYAEIGVTCSAEKMFLNNTAYTSKGFIEGVLKPVDYKKVNIEVSTTEPENVSGIWCKTSINFNKNTETKYPIVNKKFNIKTTAVETTDSLLLSESFTNRSSFAIVGNYIYVFDLYNSDSYKINLDTLTSTSLGKHFNKDSSNAVYCEDLNCIYLNCNYKSYYTTKLDLSTDKFTKISATTPCNKSDAISVYDKDRHRILIYDSNVSGGPKVYAFNTTTNTYSTISTGKTFNTLYGNWMKALKIKGNYLYGFYNRKLYKLNLETLEEVEVATVNSSGTFNYWDPETDIVYTYSQGSIIFIKVDLDSETIVYEKECPIAVGYNIPGPLYTKDSAVCIFSGSYKSTPKQYQLLKIENLEGFEKDAINICIDEESNNTVEVFEQMPVKLQDIVIPNNGKYSTGGANLITEIYTAKDGVWELFKQYPTTYEVE